MRNYNSLCAEEAVMPQRIEIYNRTFSTRRNHPEE